MSETKLTDNVFDSEFALTSNNVYRKDRDLQFIQKSGEGGLLALTKQQLNVTHIEKYEMSKLSNLRFSSVLPATFES